MMSWKAWLVALLGSLVMKEGIVLPVMVMTLIKQVVDKHTAPLMLKEIVSLI